MFVIPRHKIRPVRCAQITQRLGRSRGIDGGAIVQSPATNTASGFSFITFATIRRKKPPFLTCPKCKSLMSAALRPRQASGKFSSPPAARSRRRSKTKRRQRQKTDESEPHRSDSVKGPQYGVSMTEAKTDAAGNSQTTHPGDLQQ